MKIIKHHTVFIFLFLIFNNPARSQTATDAFFMDKGNLCIVADYSHDGWKNYWEGTKKKESHLVGTLNTNAVNAMIGFGIINNLLFTASVPYIWTNSTEFYNSGQHGIQDLGVGLKWKALEKSIPFGKISFMPSVTASIPLTDYAPDMLPYSIGIHSKTLSGNIIVHYMTDKNFFLTLQWGYTGRDIVNINADSYYYKDKLYYTSEVFVPDLIVYGAELGFDNENFRAEAWLSVQDSQGGSDIRPNDKPYPFNRMSYTKAGLAGKYHIKKIPNLSLTAACGFTLQGRNVGQSTSYNAGFQYILKCY